MFVFLGPVNLTQGDFLSSSVHLPASFVRSLFLAAV